MGKSDIDCFRELGPSGRTLCPTTNIGVSSLPDQYVNLQLKKGFSFNVMCIGSTGIGKTSLLQTLFRQSFTDDPHPNRSTSVSLVSHHYEMIEGNVNLKVTFIESRGFGDQIDKSQTAQHIAAYIDEQFDAFLREETRIDRHLNEFNDTRVHACIYIISPTGRSLTALDVTTMKAIHSKVNLIPIIGKADILTAEELSAFKTRINNDIRENGIRVYHFPADDPSVAAKNSEMNNRMPFAIVASSAEETINGRLCRVRRYPWGIVVVDDDAHCEFSHLREMLLRSNLYDLIRSTQLTFYEDFRAFRLCQQGSPLDVVMTDSIRKKCSEITQSIDQQIQELVTKYEYDVKELEAHFHSSEHEVVAKFDASLQELEQRRQEFLASKTEVSPPSQKKEKKSKSKK